MPRTPYVPSSALVLGSGTGILVALTLTLQVRSLFSIRFALFLYKTFLWHLVGITSSPCAVQSIHRDAVPIRFPVHALCDGCAHVVGNSNRRCDDVDHDDGDGDDDEMMMMMIMR